jgi:SEC-C motif
MNDPNRTPLAVTDPIRKLCGQISPGVEPIFIPITPGADCKPFDCFAGVKRKVETEGGRIQFGWSIWEWPGVFIEAEHHAVYEPPDGPPWIDITPSIEPQIIRRRLFLADDAAIYDFENEGVLRDNFRVALSDDPLIPQFFAASVERSDILNVLPGVGEISVDAHTAARLSTLENDKTRLFFSLAMKYTPQNARCFCGSDQKFKRCHGNGNDEY